MKKADSFVFDTLNCLGAAIVAGLVTAVTLMVVVLLLNGRPQATGMDKTDVHGTQQWRQHAVLRAVTR